MALDGAYAHAARELALWRTLLFDESGVQLAAPQCQLRQLRVGASGHPQSFARDLVLLDNDTTSTACDCDAQTVPNSKVLIFFLSTATAAFLAAECQGALFIALPIAIAIAITITLCVLDSRVWDACFKTSVSHHLFSSHIHLIIT